MSDITVPHHVQNPARTNRVSLPLILLGCVLLLSFLLLILNLDSIGWGNTYYAAAVRSMMQSSHNFFFVAAEPGASVTVDKPPLGLWVQTVFAWVIGFRPIALLLPQILAGVGSVVLAYVLVARRFGPWPGLAAALAMSITPVLVSVSRNNTMDMQLVFVLMLAAWAFIKAAEDANGLWLMAGAALVGVGFNIKMMQALLPLPAFYLVYLVSPAGVWWKRILHLVGATALLVVVSLSWALVVDAIPPENRPYIGSSTDNTVMELITGHNGTSRIFGGGRSGENTNLLDVLARLLPGDDAAITPANAGPSAGDGANDGGRPPNPPQNDGGQPYPPRGDGGPNVPDGPPGQAGVTRPGGGGGLGDEIGDAGLLRLFTDPLASEIGWLLPAAILSILAGVAALGIGWPVDLRLLDGVLWGGWLLTEWVFFSIAGFYHAYYMVMLAPPVTALIGVLVWSAWQAYRERGRWVGVALIGVPVVVTVAYHLLLVTGYPAQLPLVMIPAGLLLLVAVILLGLAASGRERLLGPGIGAALAVMLVAPLVWSLYTTFNPNPNVGLPRSGPQQTEQRNPQNAPTSGTDQQQEQQNLFSDWLLDNRGEAYYLLAAQRATDVAPIIIETGEPVLIMGGFSGSDPVIDLAGLKALIAAGDLRYVLASDNTAISQWVRSTCAPVAHVPGVSGRQGPGGAEGTAQVYDCRAGG